jgi:hypothetical protein
MAQWKPGPDDPVGQNEYIGRRLFDEPLLAGSQSPTQFAGLQLRHFEEKRGREFSLDRLGRGAINKGVQGYLLPRARAAGAKFNPTKQFDGWVTLRVGALLNPPGSPNLRRPESVVASPETGEGLEENVYHAHALMPEGLDYYSMALHMRELFTTHGKVHRAHSPDSPAVQRTPLKSRLAMAWKWLIGLFRNER